jgi:hypothetical protein
VFWMRSGIVCQVGEGTEQDTNTISSPDYIRTYEYDSLPVSPEPRGESQVGGGAKRKPYPVRVFNGHYTCSFRLF